MSALFEVAKRQERFYLEQGSGFSEDLTLLGFPEDYLTESGNWRLSVDPGASKTGYTARATYVGSNRRFLSQDCRWMTISGRDARESGPDPDCWH